MDGLRLIEGSSSLPPGGFMVYRAEALDLSCSGLYAFMISTHRPLLTELAKRSLPRDDGSEEVEEISFYLCSFSLRIKIAQSLI